jgi:large subunit ribosomal protein L31e
MVEKMNEQIYVIPLRDTKRAPRWRRANTAIKDIRSFLVRHMKTETVKLDASINEKVWERGSEKPPRRIRVRGRKVDEGEVPAELAKE